MSKWSVEIDFLAKLIPEVYGQGIKNGVEVRGKGCFDLVTTLDFFIEKKIGEALCSRFVGDRIMGEEYSPTSLMSGRTWVIDPIDGTVNMARGLPLFGVQVALVVDSVVVLAVMYFPFFGQLVKAEIGQGAFCNGMRMRTSNRSALEDLMISFGDFPHRDLNTRCRQHEMMARLSARVSKIRMFGAASYDLFSVALGHTDAHVSFAGNPWDILPGFLVCREAGCEIRDISGRPYETGAEGIIVASDKSVVEKILSVIGD